MSLPASQLRALGSIEGKLTAADPHLASMFAIFARLNVDEPVARERLVVRLRLAWPRRLGACAAVLIPVMFVAMIIVSALTSSPISSRACVGNYALGGSSTPMVRPACRLSGDTTVVKPGIVTVPATPGGTENPACRALVQHGRSARGWVCYK